MNLTDKEAHDTLGPYNDGPPVWRCFKCKMPMRKAYCGRCDEYYNAT